MTDFFALLDQRRRAWLDSDELKQAFHAKSLQSHPDAQGDVGADAAFAQLNEAHQVLQDPKRRIQHLLTLEGRAPARDGAVPDDIAQLFSTVAEVAQQADAAVQKAESATTPLARSLLKAELLTAQRRTAETLQRLRVLHDDAETEARRLSKDGALAEDDWATLQQLYVRFAYLGRWMAELEEKQLRLANT